MDDSMIDIQSSVAKSYDLLRKEKDFFDVTLISDDRKQIEAHKVVLSACSLFFKDLLRSHSNPNPLLYLGGVGSKDLENVLNYIYFGEVKVAQKNLEKFIETAKKFMLEGLEETQLPLKNHQKEPKDFFEQENCAKTLPGPKEIHAPKKTVEAKNISRTELSIDDNIKKVLVKNNPISKASDTKKRKIGYEVRSVLGPSLKQQLRGLCPAPQKKIEDGVYVHKYKNEKIVDLTGASDQEIKQKIEGMAGTQNNVHFCKVCDYSAPGPLKLREHIETHLEGLQFPCDRCDKIFRTSTVLRKHAYTIHG